MHEILVVVGFRTTTFCDIEVQALCDAIGVFTDLWVNAWQDILSHVFFSDIVRQSVSTR